MKVENFLVVLGLVVVFFTFKAQQKEISKTRKYPEGHFMGQCIFRIPVDGFMVAFGFPGTFYI